MISSAERWKNLIYRIWAPNEGRPEHIFSIADSHLENIRKWLDEYARSMLWRLKTSRTLRVERSDKLDWCRAWLALIDTEQKRRQDQG